MSKTSLLLQSICIQLHGNVMHALVEICHMGPVSTEKRTPNSDLQRVTEEVTKELGSGTELRRISRSEPGEHRE